jgi:hypothetical protein
MADLREQSFCVKFCFKRMKTAAETHQILKQAFGGSVLGRHKLETGTSVSKMDEHRTDDDDRSGRP